MADTYAVHLHSPSGQIRVASLAFSPHPRCWSIIAETKNGNVFDRFYRACDVEITATISRQWLDERFSGILTFFAQKTSHPHRLLAGCHELPPPPGIDHLALVAFSDHPPDSRSQLRLTPRWGFRFHAHNIYRVCGITPEFPRSLPKAIAAAHQEFRQHIAAQVARRLNPQPFNEGPPLTLARRRLKKNLTPSTAH